MACPKCDSFDVRNALSGVFRNECICNNCQHHFRASSSAVTKVGRMALVAAGGVAVTAAVATIAPVLGIPTAVGAVATVALVGIKGLISGQTA
jgi:hypothetical protein